VINRGTLTNNDAGADLPARELTLMEALLGFDGALHNNTFGAATPAVEGGRNERASYDYAGAGFDGDLHS